MFFFVFIIIIIFLLEVCFNLNTISPNSKCPCESSYQTTHSFHTPQLFLFHFYFFIFYFFAYLFITDYAQPRATKLDNHKFIIRTGSDPLLLCPDLYLLCPWSLMYIMSFLANLSLYRYVSRILYMCIDLFISVRFLVRWLALI